MAGFMLILLLFSVFFRVDCRWLCGWFHADTITVFCVVELIVGGCVAGFMLILLLFSVCFRVECRWLCGRFHADAITVFCVF